MLCKAASPLSAGPWRANKQRAETRLVLPSLRRMGGMVQHRRARFPPLPAMPDRPCASRGFRARKTGGARIASPTERADRGFAGWLMASPYPPAGQPLPAPSRPRTPRTGFMARRLRHDKMLLSRAGSRQARRRPDPGNVPRRAPSPQALRPGDRTAGATGCRRSRPCSEKQGGGLRRSLPAPPPSWLHHHDERTGAAMRLARRSTKAGSTGVGGREEACREQGLPTLHSGGSRP